MHNINHEIYELAQEIHAATLECEQRIKPGDAIRSAMDQYPGLCLFGHKWDEVAWLDMMTVKLGAELVYSGGINVDD